MLTLAGVNKLLKVRFQKLKSFSFKVLGEAVWVTLMGDHINSCKMKSAAVGRTFFGEWKHTKYSKGWYTHL